MDVRTYQIYLPDSYDYRDLKVSDTQMEISCVYAKDFKGYCCGTQGPPQKIVFVDKDETKIISASIVTPKLIVACVQFKPCTTSGPQMQRVSLLSL